MRRFRFVPVLPPLRLDPAAEAKGQLPESGEMVDPLRPTRSISESTIKR